MYAYKEMLLACSFLIRISQSQNFNNDLSCLNVRGNKHISNLVGLT